MHGLKGELKSSLSSEFLDSLSFPFAVFIGEPGTLSQHNIVSFKKGNGHSILQLQGVTNSEKATQFKNKEIYILSEDLPETSQTSEEYYLHQLEGLVLTANGVPTPFRTKACVDLASHPILQFSDGETEFMVPFLKAVVGEIDLQKKTIEVLDWKDYQNAS